MEVSDNAENQADYNNSATINYDTVAPSLTALLLANKASDTYINSTERDTSNPLTGTLNASGYTADAYKLATTATTCSGVTSAQFQIMMPTGFQRKQPIRFAFALRT